MKCLLHLPDSEIATETAESLYASGWSFASAAYDFLASCWHIRLMSPHGQLTFDHKRTTLSLAIEAALSEARTIPPPEMRTYLDQTPPKLTADSLF